MNNIKELNVNEVGFVFGGKSKVGDDLSLYQWVAFGVFIGTPISCASVLTSSVSATKIGSLENVASGALIGIVVGAIEFLLIEFFLLQPGPVISKSPKKVSKRKVSKKNFVKS